jgi:hypothetical protein
MKVGPVSPPRVAPSAPASRQARAAPGHGRSFLEVLREGTPRAAAPAPPGAPGGPKKAAPPASSGAAAASSLARRLGQALSGAAKGEAQLDAILDAAARGKTFTSTELLAMQATVFRYSQTVEVLSRATDRLVGAVKQTVGTQV